MLKKIMETLTGAAARAPEQPSVKYPGVRDAVDGNTAIIHVEREASDAAGAYPITPSTQMGEYWAEEAARGHLNVSDRPLIFVEPESEHAAAAVTAGMAMTGLRATNFSSGQGIAFMHESLYATVGKRLPYVLNMGCRAITKASLNVHAGHDDYHCIDDTGFIQVMAKSATEAADLNLIVRRLAELSLTPAIVGQDGFLTTHLIESVTLPERELVAEFLGKPDDMIETPTPAQKMLYGPKRRRVPSIWDVDVPMASGSVQNQDAYMQAVAAQRPYFFNEVQPLADRCMDEFAELTGRKYSRLSCYRCDDADYVIFGMGSMVVQAEAVADYLRATRRLRVGVVNLTMFRPFPGDLVAAALRGKKGVAVLERTDQPLAEDLPLMREVRSALQKALENAMEAAYAGEPPHPGYPSLSPSDMPRLYSGCYGLGSRDLQPEGLIGAIENMLPDGDKRKFFYLSVDVAREPDHPKDELHQQAFQSAYPNAAKMVVRGSENPNLMPKDAITVRMHSIGGWGAITTGKNLAMTLFELLGWEIKANPKYGSEKKGQPTTYYLSAAPEPIRVNCEYVYVDVVLSPDPAVFGHSNPLSGLKKGGVFIIQSNLGEGTWAAFPRWAQQEIVDKELRVFYLDAFKIAREEAGSAELQLRMQGNAFQGAFFAASSVRQNAGLSEQTLFTAIEKQLESKFGSKGARVVQNNLTVVKRGYTEIFEIKEKVVGESAPVIAKTSLPIMLKGCPSSDKSLSPVADLHRFWEQTGHFYATGKGNDNLLDPFIGASLIPAASGMFRDMTGIRFEHPEWVAENCTACGKCYTVCPDSAIPGLVNSVSEVFNAALARVERAGTPTKLLRRALRGAEKKLRGLVGPNDGVAVRPLIDKAFEATVAEAPEAERAALAAEFDLLKAEIGTFAFSATKPYWSSKEKKGGGGGLFSITVNPLTCKACALCVDVCDDNALKMVTQTDDSVAALRRDWSFWLDLPTTGKEYSRIEDLDEKIGALDTLLLDKTNYNAMTCGDGACLGCGEKTAIHLFTSTVSALMQPRVKAFIGKLDGLIQKLEQHVRLSLAKAVDLSDASAVARAVDSSAPHDLTLSSLASKLNDGKPSQPLDPNWVKRCAQLLEALKDLRWRYVEGPTRRGRANMGMVNSTGCTSVWGSTYPYHPYPFPWTSHLFQDSPSVAMGLFEGHMAKMAEGFKIVRMAEMELKGDFVEERDRAFFNRFTYEQFSDDEWALCPPVVSLGGDGAMYDIGFQNLSRMMMAGKPIKVLVVDTQVYSNTGGQACTSGFIAQVSDMAPYGAARHGKSEIRKEISLIGMAHRSSFVLQSTVAHVSHLLEGYIDGLNSRRPALFNIYAVCPPEHGVGDDRTVSQSKLAVESRAYPLFRYDPDAGVEFSACASLEGNPALDQDWPTYSLQYVDEKGAKATLDLPVTFADFAATEARFSKNFRKAPPETWNDAMLPLAELLDLPADERNGRFPYIWATDAKGRLMRLIVSQELVNSCEERMQFWRQLKDVVAQPVDAAAIEAQVREEVREELEASFAAAQAEAVAAAVAEAKAAAPVAPAPVPATPAPAPVAAAPAAPAPIPSTLAGLAATLAAAPVTAPAAAEPVKPVEAAKPVEAPKPIEAPKPVEVAKPAEAAKPVEAAKPAAPAKPAAKAKAAASSVEIPLPDYEPVWVDSPDCTACGECIDQAPGVFVYNASKQVTVKDPKGNKFSDIVKSAEKCPAECLHPGMPWEQEPKLDKLINRAKKYN
ncbi:2-oxoacid:acceptor oxidoreductase family protein [Rhodoblastus acidophilus]|nr:2-oxoacid:acceptor oxidoreductase family protein [Rhodoblastus acidophilus]PPQ37869.1 pyruvate ferredoxin oxidoreductase [Rhodoblastus acidophilus]RAI17131.1 pyruvate ferredoxin oxidoreductase [Rhodoblastus acidophilus]